MELNNGQRIAFEAVKSGRNMFVTGQAGTGKSELIKYIKTWIESQGMIPAITSYTGVSALGIKGVTLHRWAGIKLAEEGAIELIHIVKKNRNAMKNWKNTDLLVIDEISMLSPDLLYKLDCIGRSVRRIQAPFGGIQLLFSGDFAQLPPVKTDVYCFECPTWESCKLDICYLTENMRQCDPLFQKVLSEIRMGRLSDEGRELLLSRVGVKVGTEDIIPTKLFSHRKSVDEINEENLKQIPREDNPLQRFKAVDFIESKREVNPEYQQNYIATLNKTCQAKPILDLLVGAQVMLIHNLDIDMSLVNGSRGVVVRFEEYRPVVKFLNGIEMIIQTNDWEIKINDECKIVRRQIPLILAWASTYHKCQGMTLDCVELDLGDTIFSDGQFYTGISRVRTTEGMSITNLDFNGIRCDPKVRLFYETLENIIN